MQSLCSQCLPWVSSAEKYFEIGFLDKTLTEKLERGDCVRQRWRFSPETLVFAAQERKPEKPVFSGILDFHPNTLEVTLRKKKTAFFFFFFVAVSCREIAWFSSKIRNYAKTKNFFSPGRKRSLRASRKPP